MLAHNWLPINRVLMLHQCFINGYPLCLVHSTAAMEGAVMPSTSPKSFLLRLWREQYDAPLRATLIDVAKADTPRHFPTLTECFGWLTEQATKPDPALPNVSENTTIVAQKHALEK
jgi:hypothetical protein